MARRGAMGCSQARALAGRLDARGVLLCHLRPAVVRGRVVLFRIFGHFWSFPAPVQIGRFPAGLAGKFMAALIEESTITAELPPCSWVPAVNLAAGVLCLYTPSRVTVANFYASLALANHRIRSLLSQKHCAQ